MYFFRMQIHSHESVSVCMQVQYECVCVRVIPDIPLAEVLPTSN